MPNKPFARATRLAALSCVALTFSATGNAATAAEASPGAPVQTVSARFAELDQTVRAYGVAASAPASLADVNVPFTARIAHLYVSAGQRVAAGAPLAEFEPDPTAVLAYRQATTAAEVARGELARTEQLYQQQLATQSQLAQAKKTLADANQALAAQRKLGAIANQQRVTAPFDGVVMTLSAAQGAQLQAGASLMQLARAGGNGSGTGARVVVSAEPADSVHIRAGMPVTLRPLSASSTTSFRGTVQMVGRAIDPQTQLVNVAVDVADPTAMLMPGVRLAADIAISQQKHWIVPRSAVLRDAKGDYVYQVDGGRARRVNVITAVDQGPTYGVDGALNASSPVVAMGNYELKDGMAVRVTGAAR